MKTDKQAEAIRLRREGRSIKEIEELISCARSSVSRWVKAIPLTEEQIAVLTNRNPIYNAQYQGSLKSSELFRKKREQYRKEGEEFALKLEPLHIATCMLYWAEGSKSIHQARLTNSDPKMIRLFISFVRKYFSLKNDSITIRVNCYTDIHPLETIEEYWLKEMELPRECLRKGTVNYHSSYSKQKKRGKSEYGTCSLSIMKSVRIVQHIYGAMDWYSRNLVV